MVLVRRAADDDSQTPPPYVATLPLTVLSVSVNDDPHKTWMPPPKYALRFPEMVERVMVTLVPGAAKMPPPPSKRGGYATVEFELTVLSANVNDPPAT